MSATDWIDLSEGLEPEDGARLVRLLTEQEIDARFEGGTLRVPEELEHDAVAVLAGADENMQAAPEVNRARELARLTEPVTPDPLNPMQAWDIVIRLHTAGIEATTDMPAFTNMETTAGCNVLVAPADVPRAREVVARAENAAAEAAPEWLVKKAKAVVADGLEEEQAHTLRRALGMHGLASVVKQEHGAWAVRVRPGDDSLAQDVLQRLALGARADAEEAKEAAEAAATEAEAAAAAEAAKPASEPAAGLAAGARDGDEPNNSTTIITFVVLAILCFIAMRACGG